MKSLVQYIREAQEAASEYKKFEFNFTGIENGKDTIKSLVDIATDKDLDFEATEESFTITLTRDLCTNERDKIDGIQDVLQQASEIARKDTKNASSESYAQLTAKLERTVDEMVSFIDNANEEPEEEEPKKEDDKNNDEE